MDESIDGPMRTEKRIIFAGHSPLILTDGIGEAFDDPWERSGVDNAGVCYKELVVTMTNLENHATFSVLDDWKTTVHHIENLENRPTSCTKSPERARGSYDDHPPVGSDCIKTCGFAIFDVADKSILRRRTQITDGCASRRHRS